MSFAPFMWATYCDDVRQEVGNKLSFLGIYGSSLIVPSFPTTLVKLCCQFSVRVPAAKPPQSVVFKLLRDDEILFERELSIADFEVPTVSAPADGTTERVLTISTIAQLIALPVTEHCFLKARAIVDGMELRGGGLELMAATTNP